MQKAKINIHQLNFLLDFFLQSFEVYAPVKKEGFTDFEKIFHHKDIDFSKNLSDISFKRILLPNPYQLENTNRKLVFFGLKNCDVWALEYFLSELANLQAIPKREDIIVIGSECNPTEDCFCNLVLPSSSIPWDMFISKLKNDNFLLTVRNKLPVLKKLGLRFEEIAENEANDNGPIVDQKILTSAIEKKEDYKNFWDSLSKMCFGCGACTAVCPLCFCTRQEVKNDLEGKSSICLRWDSCFSKEFSEIQNHFDLRPKVSDRLYNWYHHKFVRALNSHGHILCTGCGRCIKACPANLKIKNILGSIIEKEKRQHEK